MTRIKTKDAMKISKRRNQKPSTISPRIKRACVTTKRKAERSVYDEHDSAEEYAGGHMEEGESTITDSVIRKGERIGRKNFIKTRENLSISKRNKIVIGEQGEKLKNSNEMMYVTRNGVQGAVKQASLNIKKNTMQTYHTVKTGKHGSKKIVEISKRTVKAAFASIRNLLSMLIAGGWISIFIITVVVLFGAAFAFMGGGSKTNAYIPVSKEVEAYTPFIREYARQFGIEEYAELVKAVMMQESGGIGEDPMHASESELNKRFPHEPGGITEPLYSVEIGVQLLAEYLKEAGVESPVDMQHIKLALQGYNYGNGYISWAVEMYGGYSIGNAMEFSDMMAQKNEMESYGDPQYANHVIRYYPYGRAFTGGSNLMIVEIAKSQIGNKGGEPYWSWYGFPSHVEWCACFVSWCANEGGLIESGTIPKFSGCVIGANWFKQNDLWADRSYEPMPGTIIFFDWENDGKTDHVGIVEKCEEGIVNTIEGNSGDACRANRYKQGSKVIYGYGVPEY